MVQRPQDEDYRALAEFRYRLRRFLAFTERSARAARLSSSQYQALLALRGIPPGEDPSIGYLAEHLQVRHHSAVELIDRLEKRKLVQRASGATDRRHVFVLLTSEGERLVSEVATRNARELQSVGQGLLRAVVDILGGHSR